MALNPGASYPTQTTAPDADYPYGGAQNITAPGDGLGTPWVADIVNDIFGMQQALLSEAGITPSGDPDTATASQYLDAMVALFDQSAAGSTSVAGLLQLSNDVTSTSTALAATIGVVKALKDLVNPVVVSGSIAANWCITWGKIKVQGGTVTVASTTTTITLNTGVHSIYTGAHLAFMPWINNASLTNDNPIGGAVVNSSSGSIKSRGETSAAAYISIGYDA